MEDTPENAAFWLPTHFLTDDDLFSDHLSPTLPPKPDPFSNGFDPFSSLDSPASSTETENDNSKQNDDELLAELTRQLAHSSLNPTEKPWVYSTSPQSTLTGFGPWSKRSGFSSNGSPNGPSQVPSPPLTPPGSKNDAAWELLYEAAGQVARLKMNAIAAQLNHHQQHQQNRGLLGDPRHPSLTPKSHRFNTLYDYPSHTQFQQGRRQGRGECYCNHHSRRCSGGGGVGAPQSAWPPFRSRQPQQNQGIRGVFMGGSGTGPGFGSGLGQVKKQSAGTGVFIPRRFGTTTQTETRKKPSSGCSTVLLPERVVQALNLDMEEMSFNNGVNLNPQSRVGRGFVTDHEILMARRNAVINLPRRNTRAEAQATMVGHDIRLPNDWTY